MGKVIRFAAERGLNVPVMVGGATTSYIHTAVRLAPLYDNCVVRTWPTHRRAPPRSPNCWAKGPDAVKRIREEQQKLRDDYEASKRPPLYLPDAGRKPRPKPDASLLSEPVVKGTILYDDIPFGEVAKLINWTTYFAAWQLKGRYPDIFDHPEKGEEARRLYDDTMQVLGRMELERVLRLRAVSAIVPCRAVDDDIIVDGRRIVLGRQNRPGREGFCRSLADFVSPEGYVGLFALSAGLGAEDMIAG